MARTKRERKGSTGIIEGVFIPFALYQPVSRSNDLGFSPDSLFSGARLKREETRQHFLGLYSHVGEFHLSVYR